MANRNATLPLAIDAVAAAITAAEEDVAETMAKRLEPSNA
jgi:hypothetical protein